jgi:hypothetical protein
MEAGFTDHTHQGVLSMPSRSVDGTVKSVPFKELPKETQEWVFAWRNTYRRLGLTDKEVSAFFKLTMKMRWGFSADDLEAMPPKERACLKAFRDFFITQTNRFMGNRSKPDPRAASFFGGKQPKVPVKEHQAIRLEVRRLVREGMPKKDAIAYVRAQRKLTVSSKTLQRICADR